MSFTNLGSGEVQSQAVVHGDTVNLFSSTSTRRTPDVSQKPQEVKEKIEDFLLKSGSEQSRKIVATSYLMDILPKPAMDEKWGAILINLTRPNRTCIDNVTTEKGALMEITVTGAK